MPFNFSFIRSHSHFYSECSNVSSNKAQSNSTNYRMTSSQLLPSRTHRTEPRQHAANKIFHIFYSSIYLRWWMSTVLSPFTNNFILFNILIHNLMEFSATSFTLFSFVSNVVLCWHIGKKLISDRYLCEITSIQAKYMRINLHCASVCTITPLIRWAKFKMKR